MKEYFLTASKDSCKADRASKDTQSGRKCNNGLINSDDTNTITPLDNIEETDSATNVPESLKIDTSHTSRHLPQACTDADEKHQQSMTSEGDEHDTDTQQKDDEHSVEDVTREPTSMHSKQLHTKLTCADEVIMPTKKVGCILVTSHLQQF